MPTTIGHALGGIAATELTRPDRTEGPRPWALLLVAAVVANLPDLDFVPGALMGHAERYHRGGSHSILAAVLVAATLGPAAARALGGRTRAWVGVLFAVYSSHLVLDLLLRDPTGGPGIAALWPLTDVRYALNVPGQHVLDPLRTLDPGFFRNGILGGLLSVRTVQVFLVDGLLVLPLVPLSVRWRRHMTARAHGLRRSSELAAPDPHAHVVDEVLARERGRPPDAQPDPEPARIGAGA